VGRSDSQVLTVLIQVSFYFKSKGENTNNSPVVKLIRVGPPKALLPQATPLAAVAACFVVVAWIASSSSQRIFFFLSVSPSFLYSSNFEERGLRMDC